MVNLDPSNLLSGLKVSSVVPATVTGDAIHELTNMDLAMKLHYLRSVYYYKKEAVESLDIFALKQPMFKCLDLYCTVAGRIRRSESGRPFIKCNDGGVRIFEVQCSSSLDEWLELQKQSHHSHGHKQLVSNKILGPELFFCPLVYIQFTTFKCGGMAIGFSWAHVLGDPFMAAKFINLWGQHLAGSLLPQTIHLPRATVEKLEKALQTVRKPLSARPVESVGDNWLVSNNCKMEQGSFHITDINLKHLQSKISDQVKPFEAISAMIWQCLAKIRGDQEVSVLTICQNRDCDRGLYGVLSNDQIISTVKAYFHVADACLSKLTTLFANEKKDETKDIESMVNNDDGSPDVLIYGANLTFVDMEGVDFYRLEMKGQKPVYVYFTLDGVGDKGVVLVRHEGPNGATENGGKGEELMVTLILPDNEIWQVREALAKEWSINFN